MKALSGNGVERSRRKKWMKSSFIPSILISKWGFSLPSVDDGEISLREKEKKVRPFSMLDSVDQCAAPPSFGTLRKNQSSEDILRDAQVFSTISVITI